MVHSTTLVRQDTVRHSASVDSACERRTSTVAHSASG